MSAVRLAPRGIPESRRLRIDELRQGCQQKLPAGRWRRRGPAIAALRELLARFLAQLPALWQDSAAPHVLRDGSHPTEFCVESLPEQSAERLAIEYSAIAWMYAYSRGFSHRILSPNPIASHQFDLRNGGAPSFQIPGLPLTLCLIRRRKSSQLVEGSSVHRFI